mgnify:CR=1 FL=1
MEKETEEPEKEDHEGVKLVEQRQRIVYREEGRPGLRRASQHNVAAVNSSAVAVGKDEELFDVKSFPETFWAVEQLGGVAVEAAAEFGKDHGGFFGWDCLLFVCNLLVFCILQFKLSTLQL